MSYRQGQLDALTKLGFFATPSSAVAAHAAGGALLGAGAGYGLSDEHPITSTLAGAAWGGLAGGVPKKLINESRRRENPIYRRVANDAEAGFQDYWKRLQEMMARRQNNDFTDYDLYRAKTNDAEAHANRLFDAKENFKFDPETEKKLRGFF